MRSLIFRWLARCIVAGYLLLAVITTSGASLLGQGLDPIWAAAQQRGVLRIAVEFGYRPFSDIQDDQPQGFDIELASLIAQRLDLKPVFVPSSLDSIYDDLQADKADIAASALPYAPEQGWRMSFSDFYFNAGQVLLVPQDSAIRGQTDLRDQRVGVALGSEADSYARRLQQANPKLQLNSTYDTAAEAIAALQRAELDAVIVERAAALVALHTTPQLKLVEALTFEPYALVMSNRAFRLRQAVNQVLADLEREGTLRQLEQRWFR